MTKRADSHRRARVRRKHVAAARGRGMEIGPGAGGGRTREETGDGIFLFFFSFFGETWKFFPGRSPEGRFVGSARLGLALRPNSRTRGIFQL